MLFQMRFTSPGFGETPISMSRQDGLYILDKTRELYDLPEFSSEKIEGIPSIKENIYITVPEEIARSREEYYARKSGDQMDAVDRNMMRVSDPRMPMLAPDRKSSTKFGTGASE